MIERHFKVLKEKLINPTLYVQREYLKEIKVEQRVLDKKRWGNSLPTNTEESFSGRKSRIADGNLDVHKEKKDDGYNKKWY